ncbi:hypothetical protein BESB_029440 [Besnoitia besnoiti]|uniref:Uncharacterized protein n=1 Tax=Besnoitia besnoiti TaxID=94643 RepID=A0A2A9M0N1_BESBE|nr:uncharacterized protein BESB_029440 [Besnoitia besnoiti]PFH31509.1 hypothetical protein BESB_029440 [Besnoitia besnoiti]
MLVRPLGDFPYLLRQRVQALRHWYRNSSLFAKNLIFVCLGAGAGYLAGRVERHRRLAEGDLNRSVQVTFYSLPHSPALSTSAPPATSSSSSSLAAALPPAAAATATEGARAAEEEEAWRESRRSFESVWNQSARAVQRLPGYSWTQIYRLSPQQSHVFPAAGRKSAAAAAERRGIFGAKRSDDALEKLDGCGRAEEPRETRAEGDARAAPAAPRPPDYIQLRQWFGDVRELQKRDEEHGKNGGLAAMCSNTESAEYEIIVDDSLVRIIQS